MKPFNRRTFIAASGAALAMAHNSRARAAAARREGGVATPVWSIVDARLQLASGFGAEMRRLGIPTHGFTGGDVGALWFGTLDAALAGPRPPVLIGLTRHEPLQCLDIMARSHRRMTLAQVRQRATAGSLLHVEASQNVARLFASVLSEPAATIESLASALVGAARNPMDAKHVSRVVLSPTRVLPLTPDAVAWIITAPVPTRSSYSLRSVR